MRKTTIPFPLRSSTAAVVAGVLLLSACDSSVDGHDPAWQQASLVEADDEADEADLDEPSASLPTVDDLSAEQPEGGYINGTMVARVDVAPGHFVQFWELQPGVVGIRESIAVDEVDDPTPMLEGFDESSATVLDAYRVIVPDATDEDIPLALRQAHERAVAFDAQQAELAASGLLATPPVTASSLGDGVPQELTAEPDVQAACSADLFGDTWGQQWFLDHFCHAGGFRTCIGNLIEWNTAHEYTSWWTNYGMAADFAVPARMHGGYWYHADFCVFLVVCTDEWYFIQDHDYPIQPRHVEGWTYPSGWGWRRGTVVGDPACPRVHFSYLRNK